MQPKYIILKIHSNKFYKLFLYEIKNYNHINFFTKKINGVYTIIIKCQNYYETFLKTKPKEKIYLSYIYLYTNISLILSELIIKFYEQKIACQILYSKYKYLTHYDISRLINITHAILDSNFPSLDSKKLYLYRKDLILNKLLMNFRNSNYIFIDHFAYFKLKNYHEHLEYIIEKTYSYY